MKHFLIFFLIISSFGVSLIKAQTLPRKGYLGIKASDLDDETAMQEGMKHTLGVKVEGVAPRSTANRLLIEQGDIITKINLRDVYNLNDLGDIAGQLVENQKIKIQIIRQGQTLVQTGNVSPRPLETDSVTDVLYGQARTNKGGIIRTILNKPRRLGTMPAILLVADYACTPIESMPNTLYGTLIKEWCAKGYVVMRVEKSGLGDNQQTPPCDQADWLTEAAGYAAGLQHLKQYDFVDTNSIFIFGHGIGGTIAPYIAQQKQVAGVMVYGTVWQTWFEFLLQMYRHQNNIQSIDTEDTQQLIRTLRSFLAEWLIQKKSITVLAQQKKYQSLVGNELNNAKGTKTVWGRHEKFWQQLDSIPQASVWKKVNCPVLAIWGSFDNQAFASDHQYIKNAVEQNGKTAEYVSLDSTNHIFLKTASQEESALLIKSRKIELMRGFFNQELIDITDVWLRRQKH